MVVAVREGKSGKLEDLFDLMTAGKLEQKKREDEIMRKIF